MSKCETDEQALAHRVFSVGHILQSLLLLVDLLVLRHISLIAEVIEVTSVGLGVEFGDERSSLRAKSIPVNLGEVLMLIDVLDG